MEQIENDLKLKSQISNLKTTSQNSNLRTRAYQFSLEIIRFVSNLSEKKIYWTISDQLLRSATSIGANLIEAKASSSKKDFIRYYEIALKSANETKYWLYLLKDSHLVELVKVDPLIKEVVELSNIIGASILTMKGKK